MPKNFFLSHIGGRHSYAHKNVAIIVTVVGLILILTMAAIIIFISVKYRHSIHCGNNKSELSTLIIYSLLYILIFV